MFAIGVEMMMGVMVSILLVIVFQPLTCSFGELTKFSCYHAVVLFRSREHENCGPQPGYVRAHIESEFIISSIRPSILFFQFKLGSYRFEFPQVEGLIFLL